MAVDTRQSMRWLYAQSRSARGAIVRTVALGWLAGLAVIAQAFCLSLIIHGVFIDSRPREAVTGAFAALAAAVLVRAALAWLREASAFAAGERIRSQVRLRLLERITARGPAFTRGERTGALTSVLVEQVEGLQDFYALYLPQLALVRAAAADHRGSGLAPELGGRRAAARHRPPDPALHDPGGHGG